MAKSNKLPSLDLLHELFDYDPSNGLLTKKGTNHEVGSFNKQLYRVVTIKRVKYYA